MKIQIQIHESKNKPIKQYNSSIVWRDSNFKFLWIKPKKQIIIMKNDSVKEIKISNPCK